MLRKKVIIERLKGGDIPLRSLSFKLIQDRFELNENQFLDALIDVSWRNSTIRFAAEIKTISTPKIFQGALYQLNALSLPPDILPMLIMPFLNEQQLLILEREEISGIDLCGNGVVIVPGVFSIFVTGQKNVFPSSAPIKNIYKMNSSMVARCFLSRSRYNTVQDVWREVNKRNILVDFWNKKAMSLSTVSKSLKTLENDLIIERSEIIRLLQADTLLEKLAKNYKAPIITDQVRMKISENRNSILPLIWKNSIESGIPFVASGLSSVIQYALMQRGEMISVYCPKLKNFMERLPGEQSNRFPNLELIETEDETVFFDARQDNAFRWASPVQVYLELMTGDKRDQDTAEQVKTFILKSIG